MAPANASIPAKESFGEVLASARMPILVAAILAEARGEPRKADAVKSEICEEFALLPSSRPLRFPPSVPVMAAARSAEIAKLSFLIPCSGITAVAAAAR